MAIKEYRELVIVEKVKLEWLTQAEKEYQDMLQRFYKLDCNRNSSDGQTNSCLSSDSTDIVDLIQDDLHTSHLKHLQQNVQVIKTAVEQLQIQKKKLEIKLNM